MESRKKVAALKINNIDVSEIKFGGLLGKGSFGQVYVGKWNNMECAIKYFNNEEQRLFEEEVNVLKFLSERKASNIIMFYGVVEDPFKCLVLEYAPNGDLQSYIDGGTDFPRITRYNIMIETTEAISFMHACDYLHNDIKPANILLASDYHVKLCDFGLAITCEEAKKRGIKSGTLLYCAPELMVVGSGFNTKGSDMYAWGITFWSMLHKKNPFDALDSQKMQEKKLIGAPEQIHKSCNRRVAHLFKACWRVEPEKRPTADRVLQTLIKARDSKPSAKK